MQKQSRENRGRAALLTAVMAAGALAISGCGTLVAMNGASNLQTATRGGASAGPSTVKPQSITSAGETGPASSTTSTTTP